MHVMASWLLSAMVAWVPPRSADGERYASIAQDIVDVATEAPVFPTLDGPARTALLMAAIASFESAYRADIDQLAVRGDHGHSLGLMQVKLRPGESCETRVACLRVARERIRESLDACRVLPFSERLAVYTTGRCATSPSSRYRVGRALTFWKKRPFVAKGEQNEDAVVAPPRFLRARGAPGGIAAGMTATSRL